MTTIIGTRECLVADSRCTIGDLCFNSSKLRRIRNTLVGAAGTSGDCERFLSWFASGCTGKPPRLVDIEALALTDEGLFLYDITLEPTRIDDPFYAIGSGAMAALGALHMGATPLRAIEIAGWVNPDTGGPTEIHYLRDPHGRAD